MSLVDVINSTQWFSGCMLLILAAYGFKYRQEEIARGLIGFLLLGSLWCFGAALMFHPKELGVKITLNRIKMLAVLPITFMTLKMALSYLEPSSRVKQILSYLWIVPAVFMLIVVSPWHDLIITNYAIEPSTGLLVYASGKLFGLHVTTARLMALLAFYIFWKSVRSKHDIHKTTVNLIIFAILIPFIMDWTIVNVYPSLRHYQLVPVAFMVTGLILIYAIFFQHVLDFVPFARSKIVDDFSSPCLMWNTKGQLIDTNNSAQLVLKIKSLKSSLSDELERNLRKDNSEITLDNRIYRVSFKEIFTPAGLSSGAYTILTDITESKMSERDLMRINRLKTDVLAVMSHDMGGLLGLLSLNAEVLNVNFEKLGDDYKKFLAQKISDQAREISRFSTDLMEWSKDQFSQNSFTKQKIIIVQVLKLVASEVNSLADIKNQKISYKKDDLSELNTNSKLLEIIIRNLVLNAIKHGEKDSEIIISVKDKEIKVSNQGTFEDCEKLNLFFLNQEKNTYSGLGLKICKEFCEILDCWIEFEVVGNQTHASIKGIA